MEKISVLVTSAFGLVAALAWNSAIQAIFSKYYHEPGQDVPSQIIYAVTVTIIAVLAMIWVSKAAERAKKRDEQITAKLKEIKNDLDKLKKSQRRKK
ncbi:MAG: DUF5654 family protein [archaeon]